MKRTVRYYNPPAKICGEDVFYTGREMPGGAYPFRTEDGRWGLAGADGRIVCPAVYEQIVPMQHAPQEAERFLLARRDGLWGLLDAQGEEALPCGWDSIQYILDDLYAMQRDGLWGFARVEGSRVVPVCEAKYATFRASETKDGIGVVFVKRIVRWGRMECEGRGMGYALWGALNGRAEVLAEAEWRCEPGMSGSHDRTGLHWSISDASVMTPAGKLSLVEDNCLTASFREGAYR